MDPKIPAPLKAYLKKGKATRPKENKMIYPTYKPEQSEIIAVNKKKSKKGKKEKTGKKETGKKESDIVIHKYKDEYPHIAYIPYSIPQMSLPQQQFPQQQTPFRDNRAFSDRTGFPQYDRGVSLNQFFQYNTGFPQADRRQEPPIPMQNPMNDIPMQNNMNDIPMEHMFQRQPAPYSLINPQGVIPLNPVPIEDYQVEQNLPNIPIPVANPVLPDIPLDPVRVEQVSGQRDRRDVIQDESESNGNVSDIQLEMFTSPPPPVFMPLKPINELISRPDLTPRFLEQQQAVREFYKPKFSREFISGGGYDPEDSDSSVSIPIRNRERYQPETPNEQMPIIRDRRRENTGRPRKPLSQEETQLIGSFIEIKNTIPSKNRTQEQTDIVKRGRTLYNSKKRNHKEEVEEIKKRIEDMVAQEGRQYRKKK